MHDVCDANRGDVTRRLLAIRIGGKHRPAQLIDVGRCRAGLVVVVEKLTFNPACTQIRASAFKSKLCIHGSLVFAAENQNIVNHWVKKSTLFKC